VIFLSQDDSDYSNLPNPNNLKVTFNDSIANFISNTAAPDGALEAGGAIYIKYGKVNFNHSTVSFISNRAREFSMFGGMGGAVFIDNGEMNFNDSIVRFVSNTAAFMASVIGVKENGTITFRNSTVTFSSNRGVGRGAINGGKLIVNNSSITFHLNQSVNLDYRDINGAAINDVEATFINSNITFIDNESTNGGAISESGSKIEFRDSNVSFINNTARQKGGAIYCDGAATIYLEAGEFRGNKANGNPNDIHLQMNDTIIFNPKSNQSMIMDGGITSEHSSLNNKSFIKKLGAGSLIFLSSSGIDIVGEIEMKAGSLILKDSAKINISSSIEVIGSALILKDNASVEADVMISVMEGGILDLDSLNNKVKTLTLKIDNDSALKVSVDFANNKASSMTVSALLAYPKATLLVNDIGKSAKMGQRVAFIYDPDGFAQSGFNNIDGGHRRYSFVWENDIGYLIYQWIIINPAFYANLITLGARSESLDTSVFQKYEDRKVWFAYSISGLDYSGNDYSIGKFTARSNAMRVGTNLIENGGIFAGYKGTRVKQGEDRASITDIEIGAYKEFKVNEINIKGMASFGMQSIDVNDGYSFNSNSLRFSVDGNSPFFKFADFYGAIRGGYVISDNIDDNETKINSGRYMKLDVLAGLKKDYITFNKFSLIGKAFLGLTILGAQPEFDIAGNKGKVKGDSEGIIFLGINGGIQYDIDEKIDLFAGINSELAYISTAYTFYLGLNYKFGQNTFQAKAPQIKNKVNKQSNQKSKTHKETKEIDSKANAKPNTEIAQEKSKAQTSKQSQKQSRPIVKSKGRK
jgi:predicted outer membrane repeat protein